MLAGDCIDLPRCRPHSLLISSVLRPPKSTRRCYPCSRLQPLAYSPGRGRATRRPKSRIRVATAARPGGNVPESAHHRDRARRCHRP